MNCTQGTKKISQRIAFGLITMSFVLYAIMPFNTCLPFSSCVIAGITAAMVIVSEIIFWIGGLMIGRDMALKLRKKVSIVRVIHYLKSARKVSK